MNLLRLLKQIFDNALTGLVPDPAQYLALIKPVQDPRYGDYQANCAMPLAKVLGRKPRDVAQQIVERLSLDDLLEPPEIAGPGFINVRVQGLAGPRAAKPGSRSAPGCWASATA